MRFQLLSAVKRILSPIKRVVIEEFQYRFMGKTGFGDGLNMGLEKEGQW